MNFRLMAVAVMLSTVSAAYGQALDKSEPIKPINLSRWTGGTYHPDYTGYCVTCYGGGGCAKLAANRTDWCGSDIWRHECACPKPGISGTCRKCGFFGRIFFYECRHLACGQEGGQGCSWQGNSCDTGCAKGCCGCGGHERGLLNVGLFTWIENFRARPLGGTASLTGPYTPRWGCFGWKEGPVSFHGQCVGCYETYLSGNYDARGPLNGGYDPRQPFDGTSAHIGQGDEVPAAPDAAPVPNARRQGPSAPRPAARPTAPRVSYAR